MKVDKDTLDRLKIWWNMAYDKGDTVRYDECNDICYELIGKHIEVHRFRKFSRSWKDSKMNDLMYIPEHYMNEKGILEYYYTKDDIVRLCDDNKVIGRYVFKSVMGEKIEDYVDMLKKQYYEWFMKEPTSDLFKSPVSVNMWRILPKEWQEEVKAKFGVRIR